MKLSFTERWILSNQYRILAALYPDERKDFDDAQKIIELGLEPYYTNYADHIQVDPIPERIVTEAQQFLDMYDVLNRSYAGLSDKSGIEEHNLTFAGFDANDPEEHKYLVAAQYACGQANWRWKDIPRNPDCNSHMPRLPYYRKMHAEWNRSTDRLKLTTDDIVRITSVTMRD